ncbi:MAG: DUF58 domain-containing protein, partial [Myxococcales bacterium]|nr:DUF58 domain-containing protein [Myxococcales bacterium]
LPVVTALGALPFVALAGVFASARVARHRLVAEPLRLLLRGGDTVRLRVGRRVTLDLDIVTPLGVTVHELLAEPAAASPLVATAEPQEGRGEGDDPRSHPFRLVIGGDRVGDYVLLGFHVRAAVVGGLFEVRVWAPAELRLEVMPRHFPVRSDAELRATRASMQEHSGAIVQRRRGLGMEIRELRDFQAGDPFKHIAWTASARRGKLISREFESDLVLSTWILVDCSPSMFWGPPGEARIDYAIELAHNLAHALTSRRDRAGLLVHDHRVRLQVPPAAGRHQMRHIIEALTEIPHLVHEDRTEITDRELVERVSRWFLTQEGRSFALPEGLVKAGSPRLSQHDEGRLIEAAQESLHDVPTRRGRRPLLPYDGYASDYQRSVLRAFCRYKGIPLPLDPTPRPGGQSHGLEAAIQAVMAARGGPHTIVAVSDLTSIDDLEPLRRTALAARRRHHSLVLLCPDHHGFDLAETEPGADRLQDAIIEVERLRMRQNLALARTMLRPGGTVFLSVGPEDALARVLARLSQVA